MSKVRASPYPFKDTPRSGIHYFCSDPSGQNFSHMVTPICKEGWEMLSFLGQQRREIQGYRETAVFLIFLLRCIIYIQYNKVHES